MHQFRSRIERPEGVGTWHYLKIPFDTVAAFGHKGQIRVRGTLGGVPFRSTLLPDGITGHYLVVGKELRDEARVSVGDQVELTLELDDAPREVELHPELADALEGNEAAQQAFSALSYSRRKELNKQVVDAKRDETRAKRIAAILALLTPAD